MGRDIQKMMKQAQKMAAEMQKAQEGLADIEVEGSAGGGAVKVRATGDGHILSVTLDPEFLTDFDADDVEMLGVLRMQPAHDGEGLGHLASIRVLDADEEHARQRHLAGSGRVSAAGPGAMPARYRRCRAARSRFKPSTRASIRRR